MRLAESLWLLLVMHPWVELPAKTQLREAVRLWNGERLEYFLANFEEEYTISS